MTEQTPADAYIESCLIDLSKQLTAAQKRIVELEAALEKARSIAKNGWITANCGTIGDADYGAELCEYIADQIAALGEKKDG